MRKLFFILSIVSVVGLAQNWMVDTDTVLSNSQTPGIRSYGKQERCIAANPAKTCVEFTGRNLRFERNVGGVWLNDVPSKTAYDAAIAAKAAKQVENIARRGRLVTAPADAAAANSVPALRVIVQDMAAELNAIIGN